MINDEEYLKRKGLRFVLSVEQMKPYLDRIQDSISSGDDYSFSMIQQNDSDSSDSNDERNHFYQRENGDDIATITIPPAISALATAASIALPNIYEEYVNFIDLSVLNPIVDAADCQKDSLIESEISEPAIILFQIHIHYIEWCDFLKHFIHLCLVSIHRMEFQRGQCVH